MKRCGNTTLSGTPMALSMVTGGGADHRGDHIGDKPVAWKCFQYLRNSALDARNFFDNTKGAPPFKRNQFGGSLGGPLKKDKAFLFGNYEGFRQRLAVSSVAIVPSAQARQGLLPNASGVYVLVPNLQRGMLPFFRYFPEPTGPELLRDGLPTGTAYFYGNPRQKVREDFGLVRFDYTLSPKIPSRSTPPLMMVSEPLRLRTRFSSPTRPTSSQTLSVQETPCVPRPPS